MCTHYINLYARHVLDVLRLGRSVRLSSLQVKNKFSFIFIRIGTTSISYANEWRMMVPSYTTDRRGPAVMYWEIRGAYTYTAVVYCRNVELWWCFFYFKPHRRLKGFYRFERFVSFNDRAYVKKTLDLE